MKRRGMALGLAALMTCTALFTTTAKAENKGSDEKETIKFTYWGSGDEKKAIEESVDKFMEANPNIEVDLMHIPSEDFLTKLNAMIAAGEAPDVSYSASWKCQMGEDGLIYNFYDLLDDMGLSKDDYLSTCWWNWSPTESAGPVQANVTTNLMYNVDCFEEAGVDLPPTKVEEAWSWDEFVEMAQKLTLDTEGRNAADPDFDANNIKQYGVMFGTDWNVYMPFILSAGGGYLNESMDGLGLNDEKSAQILQNFADLINVYHVSPTAVQKNAMPSAATALAAKQTAMYIDGSWNHLDLMNSGCNWGVGVLPIDENYTTFFDGGSLIIFKSTKHLEASEKLYLWLTNPESSERITELYRTLWMPVQTEYYTDPDKIDFWASEELPARPEGFQDAIVMHLPVSTWLSGESSVIPTLVFINLWTTGSTMVIFLAGMQDVPRQLLEAVEIDGGGFWAKLLHVTIPMMTPTIFYNVVMGIINGFQIFTQSYVMTQGGPNNSSLFYVYYLYREAFEFGRMGNACAVAWVLFLIIMVLTAVIFKFSNRWVYYGGE